MRGVPPEETHPKLYTANTNSYSKFLAITVCWIAANKVQDREKVIAKLSVCYITHTDNLAYVVSAIQTETLVKAGKLDRMARYWSHGRWNTRGRLGKGANKALGVTELPILRYTSRHTELIMLDAHLQDHRGAKTTVGLHV